MKITINRKTHELVFVDGWEDKNDVSEQKFIDEFAKLFINDKQEGRKPRVDDLAV